MDRPAEKSILKTLPGHELRLLLGKESEAAAKGSLPAHIFRLHLYRSLKLAVVKGVR
jgi:hypothetical protein